jgi:hypothetical protein
MTDQKITIARSERFKNGVIVSSVCNPKESFKKSWVLSVPVGQFRRTYAAYGDSKLEAIKSLCFFDIKQEGMILPRIDLMSQQEVANSLVENEVVCVSGEYFSYRGVFAEEARIMSLDSRFEAIIGSSSLADRMSSLKIEYSKTLSAMSCSSTDAIEEKDQQLKAVMDLYSSIGGRLFGEKLIEIKSAVRSKEAVRGISTQVEEEFGAIGIPSDAFRIEVGADFVGIEVDRNDIDRALIVCNKIKAIDPTDSVQSISVSKLNRRYIPDVGKTPFSASVYLSRELTRTNKIESPQIAL